MSTTSGVSVGPESALSYIALYRAVSLISQTIGSLPIHLRRRTTINGRPAREFVVSHPIALTLRSPNTDQTPLRFFEFMAKSMAIWGNFYGEIEVVNGVTRVWPLPPNIVDVSRTVAGELVYVVRPLGGNAVELTPDRVVHVALLGDDVKGKSPVSLARESIGLGLATQIAGAALFGNGIMPSGILVHPGELSDKALANLRKQKIDGQTSPSQKRKVLILEQGMKWEQIGIPPEDAQFLETRIFQIQEMARLYGIPAHMLAENSRATFSNITQQSIEFVQHTLRHWLVRIEQELNRKLLGREADLFVKFEVEGLLRGDPEAQAKFWRQMFELGAFNTNDILELMDRNPIGEEGEVRFVPANLIPIERAMQGPQPLLDSTTPPDETAPSDGERIAASFRNLFRDAAGRVVHKEIVTLRKLLKKHGDDCKAIDTELRMFFRRHESYVAETFGPVWRERCNVMAIDMCDTKAATSRYINNVRTLMLTLLEKEGVGSLHKLVSLWNDNRADNVTVDYLEA